MSSDHSLPPLNNFSVAGQSSTRSVSGEFPCLLSDVSVLCRVSVDEDGASQAQHVRHPLPPVDLGYRAHFSRGQQRGKVKETPGCNL